jgi:lipocalin
MERHLLFRSSILFQKASIERQLFGRKKRTRQNFVANKSSHNLLSRLYQSAVSNMNYFFFTVAFLLASPTSAFLLGWFNWFDTHDCPDINPPTNFDIDEYISKTWYVQKQQVNSYQKERDLFCVTATYEDEGRRQWFRKAITVRNYANRDEVNNGSDGAVLCATRKRPDSAPAELAVAPCWLPAALFGGPYWVAAFASDYSWAIVTGGQPTEDGKCDDDEDTCANVIGRSWFGDGEEGLWFLTREKDPNFSVMPAMELAALNLGICTAAMKDVEHDGCLYEGATIKS